MKIIKVPKPPRDAFDKNRPLSSLLRTQLDHLQHAELRLPAHHQSLLYVNAIRTEGEAAQYIEQVTSNIHSAHKNQEYVPHQDALWMPIIPATVPTLVAEAEQSGTAHKSLERRKLKTGGAGRKSKKSSGRRK